MATQEVGYVLAPPESDGIAVSGATAATVDVATRQGHAFCGVCCDMRRAVIMVNIINIIFSSLRIVAILFLLMVTGLSYDDGSGGLDENKKILSSFDEANLGFGVVMAYNAIKIVANSRSINGAVTFDMWGVGISLVVYYIDFVMGVVYLNIFKLVMATLFAYPHFFFIDQVRRGIMSKANYANEKFSCCCVQASCCCV